MGAIYGSEGEALRLVRSSGSVFALCEQDFCISVPMKYDKKVYTGRKKIKKSLIFFEKEVKFFGNSRNLYASCDKIDVGVINMVEEYSLFSLLDRYDINHNNILSYKKDILLDKADYKKVEIVLSFLSHLT